MRRRTAITVALLLVPLVLTSSAIGRRAIHTRSAQKAAIDPHVAMGGHLFAQFACVVCHGLQGRGGVSPEVPALKSIGKGLTVKQLSSIINHGLGESTNPKKP